MAETAAESWWIKVGVLYDKAGFKGVVGGMLDIKKAASGLYDSFRKVVDVNSDLYNTARYLNVSTNDLQVWERAFRLIGGSAEDARGAISSLNFVYDKLRLGLDQGAAETGARLGLTPEDYTSFDRMLKALNTAYNTMYQGDYGGFKVLAEQLGLSESAMLLVTQSTRDFESTLNRAQRIPLIPEHQLKAARELNIIFTELSISWDNFKAKLMSTSMPALSKVFTRISEALANPEMANNLEIIFQRLEKGFNDLATDDNITRLINSLGAIAEATMKVAGWGIKGINYTVEKAQETGGVIGGIVGNVERGQSLSEALELPYLWSKITGTDKIEMVQNININGAQSPRAVAEEVVDVTNQALDANSSMRTIENMRANTAL